MPTGIIVDVLSVALGGAIGFLIKDKLSDQLKTNLNVIFGICSMAMAITSINLRKYMPAVIFAIGSFPPNKKEGQGITPLPLPVFLSNLDFWIIQQPVLLQLLLRYPDPDDPRGLHQPCGP